MAETYETLLVEKEPDGVTWLWFNTPEKRNRVTPELSREMNLCLDRLKDDDGVRVLILSGKGPAFCAGMDLKVFHDYQGRPSQEWSPSGFTAMDWWEKFRVFPKPTIAAVNGYAFGGGVIPVAYADVAIASDKALFGLSEINWGSPPGGGATRAVLESMPLKWAKWLVLSGQQIDGNDAVRIGLANWCVEHDSLLAEAARVARLFLPHHPIPLAWAKRQILESLEVVDHLLAIEVEGAAITRMRNQTGFSGMTEGWKGFMEKRYRPGLESYDFRPQEPQG